MQSLDPRPVIDSLRSQLATHDKRIVFLIGAGASSAVKENGSTTSPLVPSVSGLTDVCKQAVNKVGKEQAAAWSGLEAECKSTHGKCDIEVMLSRLRMKLDAMSPTDSLLGLSRDKIEGMERTITGTIAVTVSPKAELVPDRFAHHDLGTWIATTPRKFPVEIFTTNYDLLIERALEDQRVPTFDGFVGSHRAFFSPDSLYKSDFAPGRSWTRRWKVHGSVNWKWENIFGKRRIVRSEPVITGEMILPTHHKYDESRKQPYLTLLERLRRVIEEDDTLLITCGYSFNDEHINSVMFEALAGRPRTHVVSLQFEDVAQDSHLDKAALTIRNLVAVGPNAGIVGGKRVTWAVPDSTEDIADEAIVIAKSGDKPPKTQVLLGDFVKLCTFLANLSVR